MSEIPKEITESRWEHSLKVAKYAEQLAILNGYKEPRLAFLCGIVHDVTKQKKKEFHLELLQEDPNFDINSIPEEAYHAFSSSRYLLKKYSFDHKDVFSAISSHTLGKKEMSLLDSIIYASDFLGSDFAAKQESFHEWLIKTKENLNFGIYLKASKTIHHLIEAKKRIFPSTIDTYNQSINQI